MFWPIGRILGVLWVLGLWSGYTLGEAVHLMLAGAIVMTLIRIASVVAASSIIE